MTDFKVLGVRNIMADASNLDIRTLNGGEQKLSL